MGQKKVMVLVVVKVVWLYCQVHGYIANYSCIVLISELHCHVLTHMQIPPRNSSELSMTFLAALVALDFTLVSK